MRNENSEAVIKCQKRKKQNAVNHFGGKCQICGYNRCLDALEFHHVDKNLKEEAPAYIIMRWSWKRAFEELKKCILICSNCHRELHSNNLNRNLNADLVVPKPYEWIEGTCKRCGEKFPTKKASPQIYCNPRCYHLDTRQTKRPSKEELKRLMEEKVPWKRLGKMFGVSDNAVRKWAKHYDLMVSKL
jgi:hypothetical protein